MNSPSYLWVRIKFLKKIIFKDDYWSFRCVRRSNHENGIAPYNSTVAVTSNSEVLSVGQSEDEVIQQLFQQFRFAAKLVGEKHLSASVAGQMRLAAITFLT
ncbi:hypothetical protein [Sphingobacterium sp. DR205]|uniref:hypothetical protein n=1 Tax=Sphingobacterium sp. DR205 TaxID=2713573 RepID=UPI0013E484AB|nr:hypothetical protein [Sphingobacterium sp. DR205]QIH34790.1 hypothetical protein G6053_18645 [Sphingobacterium sp. DR205]